MSTALNLLWFFIGGGLVAGILWFVTGLVLCATIIGIPVGIAAFRIGAYTLWPFGRDLVDARLIGDKRVFGTTLINALWILLAGIWLALSHAALGLIYCVTIIGIPFGLAHLKITRACFVPLGVRIVSDEMAKAAKQRAVNQQLSTRLGQKES